MSQDWENRGRSACAAPVYVLLNLVDADETLLEDGVIELGVPMWLIGGHEFVVMGGELLRRGDKRGSQKILALGCDESFVAVGLSLADRFPFAGCTWRLCVDCGHCSVAGDVALDPPSFALLRSELALAMQ